MSHRSAKKRKAVQRSRQGQTLPAASTIQQASGAETTPRVATAFSPRKGTASVKPVASLDHVKPDLKRIAFTSVAIVVAIVVLSFILT